MDTGERRVGCIVESRARTYEEVSAAEEGEGGGAARRRGVQRRGAEARPPVVSCYSMSRESVGTVLFLNGQLCLLRWCSALPRLMSPLSRLFLHQIQLPKLAQKRLARVLAPKHVHAVLP